MLKGVLAGLIVAIVMTSAAIAGPFQDGLAAAERGDYATARELWRPLAEQGNAPAQFNLGLMYQSGIGVPRDYATAVKWFQSAAERGDARAQYNLGLMYGNGDGVPQGYALADMWITLAAAQGNKDAIRLRDLLAQSMAPDQLAEAQRMAREWKPTPAQ
jgi:TPR repeat protein